MQVKQCFSKRINYIPPVPILQLVLELDLTLLYCEKSIKHLRSALDFLSQITSMVPHHHIIYRFSVRKCLLLHLLYSEFFGGPYYKKAVYLLRSSDFFLPRTLALTVKTQCLEQDLLQQWSDIKMPAAFPWTDVKTIFSAVISADLCSTKS